MKCRVKNRFSNCSRILLVCQTVGASHDVTPNKQRFIHLCRKFNFNCSQQFTRGGAQSELETTNCYFYHLRSTVCLKTVAPQLVSGTFIIDATTKKHYQNGCFFLKKNSLKKKKYIYVKLSNLYRNKHTAIVQGLTITTLMLKTTFRNSLSGGMEGGTTRLPLNNVITLKLPNQILFRCHFTLTRTPVSP